GRARGPGLAGVTVTVTSRILREAPVLSFARGDNLPSRSRRPWRAHAAMTPRMQMLSRLFAAALAATLAVPAAAQQWPTRALRIVTGTPAGGRPGFVSRFVAHRLRERPGPTGPAENSPA